MPKKTKWVVDAYRNEPIRHPDGTKCDTRGKRHPVTPHGRGGPVVGYELTCSRCKAVTGQLNPNH